MRHDPAKMSPGLTLFTSSHKPAVLLMNGEGKIVHEWVVPPERVTGASEPDKFVYLRRGHVFPNGDLLTIFEKVDATPWGIAMVKVNTASEPLWTHERPFHHDFDVGPDGRIYALDTTIVTQPFEGLDSQHFPLLDDDVVVLSSQGRELQRVSITKALIASPYRRLIDLLGPRPKGDLLHTNSVQVVTRELAATFPLLAEGQVIVSVRQANMIAAIDLERATVSWATHGYWMRQHDVELLANGRFILFDNLGHFGTGGVSRVLEIDPNTMQIAWQYVGTESAPFGSRIRSSQHRLENGNTLITESDAGRLIEVTSDGEVVWEFRSPWRSAEGTPRSSVLSWAERVDVASFEGRFADEIRATLGQIEPGSIP